MVRVRAITRLRVHYPSSTQAVPKHCLSNALLYQYLLSSYLFIKPIFTTILFFVSSLYYILVRLGLQRRYVHSVQHPKHIAGRSHGFKLVWIDYEFRRQKTAPPPVSGTRAHKHKHKHKHTCLLLPLQSLFAWWTDSCLLGADLCRSCSCYLLLYLPTRLSV